MEGTWDDHDRLINMPEDVDKKKNKKRGNRLNKERR